MLTEFLRQDFERAVEHLSSTSGEIPDDVQRRLFGLFHRVHSLEGGGGRVPSIDSMAAEQREAIQSIGDMSADDAMREYVDLVETHDSTYLFESDAAPASDSLNTPATDHGDELCLPGPSTAGDIFEAVRSGATEAVAAFLPASASAVDEDGLTALHHAVDTEQPAAVAALLTAGATVNACDHQRATPLHYAALLGSEPCADLLLKAGAKTELLDDDGLSAAAQARAEGHTALASLIDAAAADQPATSDTP